MYLKCISTQTTELIYLARKRLSYLAADIITALGRITELPDKAIAIRKSGPSVGAGSIAHIYGISAKYRDFDDGPPRCRHESQAYLRLMQIR